MMSAKKRVGLLHTHRLAVRHSVDYSFSHHFASDDSLRDSSSSSSSKTSSDPSSDDLSDSSSDHSLPASSSGMRPSHHLCSLVPSIPRLSSTITDRPSHDSSFMSHSRKRSRSPTASVSLSSSIPGALSYARANLLPSPKRIRSSEFATDLEAEIDECVAYADALRVRGIDVRVVVEVVDREEIETGARGPVKVRVDKVTHLMIDDDIPDPAQEEGAVELERDNMRLRDMMDVTSQRVTRSQRRELRVQREMRQIRRFRFYDRQCLIHDLEHQGYVKELTKRICRTKSICITKRFQELVQLCTRIVPNEEDKVERFVRGSPDNIQGNVIAAEPTKLQDEICIANNLMDQKLKGYTRSAKNKRRLENNPRNNHGQEPAFKRQNILGVTGVVELVRKGNYLTDYTRRFQELVLLCTRMVPNEEDKVERFVGGLPDNIQGNIMLDGKTI
ncbi:hypothetical protein Tco_1059436 [Tanacetum coccineum]